MSKINNKLILILGILAFIFGLLLASPAYARGGPLESGLRFTPYDYPVQYVNNTNTNTNNNPSNNSSSTNVSNTTTQNSDTSNTTVSKTTDSNTNDSYSSLTANALVGSNSFLPTGLMQWIILAVIIVAIIFLWRYVHAEDKYLSEPLKHA